MKIFLTGGCGFIGSAVIRRAIAGGAHDIVQIGPIGVGFHRARAQTRHIEQILYEAVQPLRLTDGTVIGSIQAGVGNS